MNKCYEIESYRYRKKVDGCQSREVVRGKKNGKEIKKFTHKINESQVCSLQCVKHNQ